MQAGPCPALARPLPGPCRILPGTCPDFAGFCPDLAGFCRPACALNIYSKMQLRPFYNLPKKQSLYCGLNWFILIAQG